MTPWTDRSGRFSPLKATVLVGLLLPATWICWCWLAGWLGPRPVEEAIHMTGNWAIRLLLVSLAVTPLRRIADRPKLIVTRRMIGLAALFYGLAHFGLYIVDQNLDLLRVASEIFSRYYLTIGFAALLALAILGLTSNDAAIRRLGGAWSRLHRIVYAIGILAVLHFFMQTKADVYEATLTGGLFVLLMSYRVAQGRGFSLTSPLVLVEVAIVSALATAMMEYAWYGLATGIPPSRVLAANLQFAFSVRPAWWVLATGLAVSAIPAVVKWAGIGRRPKSPERRPTGAPAA